MLHVAIHTTTLHVATHKNTITFHAIEKPSTAVMEAYTQYLDVKTLQMVDDAMRHSGGKFPMEWLKLTVRRLAAIEVGLQDRERQLVQEMTRFDNRTYTPRHSLSPFHPRTHHSSRPPRRKYHPYNQRDVKDNNQTNRRAFIIQPSEKSSPEESRTREPRPDGRDADRRPEESWTREPRPEESWTREPRPEESWTREPRPDGRDSDRRSPKINFSEQVEDESSSSEHLEDGEI